MTPFTLLGVLAKTDQVDAKVLARFAEAIRPEVRALRSSELMDLDSLLTRRRQLVEMIMQKAIDKPKRTDGLPNKLRSISFGYASV